MSEVRYLYGPAENPAGYNPAQLAGEIAAVGLPPCQVYGSGFVMPGDPVCNEVQVGFDPGLSAGQKTTLDGVIIDHVPGGPRRPRLIIDIWHDVGALGGAQKVAIWNDLNAGSPPKWAQDRGPNAADLHLNWLLATQIGAVQTAADKQKCQQMLISVYCLDYPAYLVHPPFDNSINISGDEPVPA